MTTNPKTIAIVQARMGSKRLPGKVMLPIAGKPAIQHILDRVSECRSVDEVWLATSGEKENDGLIEFVQGLGYPVFVGSEDNVLSRFVAISEGADPTYIVRVTGDCPLVDPTLIDDLVAKAWKEGAEYLSNTIRPTYPDGLDIEVFTSKALKRAGLEATSVSDLEHVTPFIRRHSKTSSVELEEDYSHLRWTLDHPEDYQLIRFVFEKLGPSFGWREVLELSHLHPIIFDLNTEHKRNEGYSGD